MEAFDPVPVLFAVALLAGLVDAVAGGGGLISVPALLWVGLPPVSALATNKAQAVFGSLTATVNFTHKGVIDWRRAASSVACTFVGAAAGALLIQHLGSDLLARVIPLLLIGFALYFAFSPRLADLDSQRRIGELTFALTVGTGIGFYDGFFGPGTGTLFAIGFIALLGYNLRRATAHTKLLNFTSNLAALLCFLPAGHVVWPVALVMGMGQLAGAWVGSHLVLRHGARLVRPVLVVVSLAVSLRLLLGDSS